MSVLKFARNAAIAASAAMLPAGAVAATAAQSYATVRAGAAVEEENDQFAAWNDFIVPAIVVVALGVGIYFIVDTNEDQDDNDLPTSP